MIQKKVLVIDDEPSILEVVKIMLEGSGFSVLIAEDGEIVNDISKSNKPDVILLDVLLKGEDGRDVARTLKNREDTKDIPIILISAHASAATAARECGANDFIPKPFDMNLLIAKVSTYANV